jgi:hypothetical protein
VLCFSYSRETVDIDVVSKQIPDAVLKIAKVIAKKLNYPEDWLNNKVHPIIERLPEEWEDHLIVVYSGKAVTIRTLSRQDLISAKLHAAIERRAADYADLIDLKPTLAEIDLADAYCLRQGTNETYANLVRGYARQLKKDLGLI